jgi:acetyltransferase-like isoleucine patch superfamily enzyme
MKYWKENMIGRIKRKICKIFNISYKEISGINNKINNQGKLINSRINIIGDNNSISILSNSVLCNTNIIIFGNNHSLLVEENIMIKEAVIRFEDFGSNIKIGKNTTIESVLLACTEPHKTILIGSDCMFSENVQIRTGDSHTIYETNNNNEKKAINPARDIVIGDHVWLAANVVVLKGVKIGNNTVIGIGTIVTQDVQEDSVCAGIPAKVIKTNTNWSRMRFYNPF